MRYHKVKEDKYQAPLNSLSKRVEKIERVVKAEKSSQAESCRCHSASLEISKQNTRLTLVVSLLEVKLADLQAQIDLLRSSSARLNLPAPQHPSNPTSGITIAVTPSPASPPVPALQARLKRLGLASHSLTSQPSPLRIECSAPTIPTEDELERLADAEEEHTAGKCVTFDPYLQ
jgi:hypothetical protein